MIIELRFIKTQPTLSTFDYIIIGAGSAGCVLANRLSRDPSNQVLLLEAGGSDRHPLIQMPGGYPKLHRSKFDWQYWTTPQTHILNRRIYLPRGRVLGGSSSTNAMAYVRGNRTDFEEWASFGNEGWDYESVLPYFKRSEQHAVFDDEFHGQQGELHVDFATRFRTKLADSFVQAGQENGFRLNEDYNGEIQEGISYFQFTIKNGQRHSAATAFLRPAMKRTNLTVITQAQVREVLIENDRAIGIRFQRKGSEQVIKARQEIILSAGAFNSPQLLMLSGIGEKAELEKLGITVKKELHGVGKNLQDHLFFPMTITANERVGVNHYLPMMAQLKETLRYFSGRRGAFTIGPLEAVAFEKLAERKYLQWHFTPFSLPPNYAYDLYDLTTFSPEDGCTILPTLLNPKSRGKLQLDPNDVYSMPIIDPNFLSDEEDLNVLVKGAKTALNIFQQAAFDRYRKALTAPLYHQSDDDLAQHILQSVETVYHPVGTCKMGEDDTSVVDAQLRVHGIEGLRVIDASIMPTIVSGNTNAAVYMIAEKGAEMILESNTKFNNEVRK
ncbi:MAG: GMC family oxidoreductase N-terminal domain-containing protein [Bacteroidota bacterium]